MDKLENIINLEPENACILVVDDIEANIMLINTMLRKNGFENIISTRNSLEVLDLYEKNRPDLIVLDLNMPVMDGFGVMDQLGAAFGESLPPILVLTAQDMQELRQRALDSGASDYVIKPFDGLELRSRVRNLLKVQLSKKYMMHQNEILEKKVEERTRVIHDTRLQVVRRLGRAAEYRDNETGLHIIRMSKICLVIARAYGMDEQQCDLLLNSAPMHDVGKIGIPDNILLKPGKFEPEEWEIMQTHSEIGANIFSGDDSDLMKMSHDIALYHHEKWNGKGYPKGLKGEEIPLVARIAAVADVFDALTSDRPYKKAWPVEKAVDLIREESGQHFDPKLVELFLENLAEINEIREKYKEPEGAFE